MKLLSELVNFKSVGKLFETIGATNFFDQNTCFLKDILVSKQKISYLLDFDQRKSFLKNLKSVRTKVLIKSFTNLEAVNFLKVFHSSVTSLI